jgi:SAM-dependent methyltransferase
MRSLFFYPQSQRIELDDPRCISQQREMFRKKLFLRQLYKQWYGLIEKSLPQGEGRVLEIGSGAGFLDEFLPDVITSEFLRCDSVNAIIDAHRLPFREESLKAIVMTDVLHHLPQPRLFFTEAARCVRPGGVVSMIEPWNSLWSRFIYQNLHHEPFLPSVSQWEFVSKGPLSSANGALPWIIFSRDGNVFEREFPCWTIEKIKPFMPLLYLLSGGVSFRSFAPSWSFKFFSLLERALDPVMGTIGMFAHIVLRRSDVRSI